MKNNQAYCILLLLLIIVAGCKKTEFPGKYPGAVISPYISIYDIKDLYKGNDLTLTREVMYGSDKITGIVVSDHSGNNLPAGLLVVQDKRRLAELRGISISIGADATAYVPGDSVVISVEGGILKRVNGILQITGLHAGAVTKVSSGNAIPVNRVPANLILANPDKYEGTLAVVVKAGFNPLPAPADVLSGDKIINDGFGDLTLHTEPAAAFAKSLLPFSANFYGIVFNTVVGDNQLVPQFRMRNAGDVVVLSSAITVTPVVISGFMSDVAGSDANYEYVQLLATRDIDFRATPYSVVFTNNANASTPAGYPVNGWGTGGLRTYKFNLTSGAALKGTFFYVGGSGKTINGSGSTGMSASNWVRAFNYSTADGDGFGTRNSGLLANSGNASGIAVFADTAVNAVSTPVDVIFIGTGGSLFSGGQQPSGYRIANTDFYDIKNPISLEDQPFYRSGSNTLSFNYNTADLGYFNMLGGEYSPALGRWTKARAQKNVLLSKTSQVSDIEGAGATVIR